MKRLGILYFILNFFNCYTSENSLLARYQSANERFIEINGKVTPFVEDVISARGDLPENILKELDLGLMNLTYIVQKILRNKSIFEPDLDHQSDDDILEAIKGCINFFEKDIQKLDEKFQDIRKLLEEATFIE